MEGEGAIEGDGRLGFEVLDGWMVSVVGLDGWMGIDGDWFSAIAEKERIMRFSEMKVSIQTNVNVGGQFVHLRIRAVNWAFFPWYPARPGPNNRKK